MTQKNMSGYKGNKGVAARIINTQQELLRRLNQRHDAALKLLRLIRYHEPMVWQHEIDALLASEPVKE